MENTKPDKENDGIWIGDKQRGIQITNDGIYFWKNGEKVYTWQDD